MSELQQEAVRMISGLSDENITFLIEVICRLMPQNDKTNIVAALSLKESEGIQALKRLNAARKEIWQYFPKVLVKNLMVISHFIPSLISGIFCRKYQKIKEENG